MLQNLFSQPAAPDCRSCSKSIKIVGFAFVLFFQVLELICTREAGAVFEAGGLACVLSFIRDNASIIHKDTLHSAMSVVSR